jgi:hypothetical protein
VGESIGTDIKRRSLIPKLIPFALECEKDLPGMWIQEDNAPAHNKDMLKRFVMPIMFKGYCSQGTPLTLTL